MENEDKIQEVGWEGHITLVRHGQTNFNVENRFLGVSDDPLNKNGKNQAKKASQFLYDWSVEHDTYFDLILSSPMKRAYETAKAFEKMYNLEVIKEPLLIERNYGIFEGNSQREMAEKYPELFEEYKKNKPFVNLPDGETALDVEDRVKKLLTEKIPAEYADKKEILIVSHLNPIRAFFRLLGLSDWDIYFKAFNNTSLSRIRISRDGFSFDFCDKCPQI